MIAVWARKLTVLWVGLAVVLATSVLSLVATQFNVNPVFVSIPKPTSAPMTKEQTKAAAAKKSASTSTKYYTVTRFDANRKEGALGFIAAKHGTTVPKLVSLNHIANPDLIYPGQRLRVR